MNLALLWTLILGTFFSIISYSSLFQRPYLETKEVFFSLTAVAAVILLTIQRKPVVVPNALKFVGGLTLGLMLYSGGLLIYFGKPIPLNIFASFIEPILYIGIFYVLFRGREENNLLKWSNVLWVTSLLIITVGSYYFIFVEMDELKRWSYIPFLGNTNMGAQVLGLSLPFMFYNLSQSANSTNRFIRRAKPLILGLTLAFLPFLKCRSIGLAIIACLFFVPWKQALKHRFEFKTTALSFILGFGVLITFAYEHFYFAQEWAFTDSSTTDRWELITSSLQLFLTYPLGIGFDQFSFEFIPFGAMANTGLNEKIYDENPHNEFLKVLVELGILGGVLVTSLFFYLAKKLNDLRVSQWQGIYRLIGAGLTVTLFETALQFPWQNCFSLILICAYIALLLYYTDAKTTVIKARFKWLLVAATALIVGFNFSHLKLSYQYAASGKRIEKLGPLCDEYPHPWRACSYLSEELIKYGQIPRAQETLQSELKRNPYNFLSLRFLSTTLFMTGKENQGCLVLHLYNSLFQDSSSLLASMKVQCSEELIKKYKDKNEFQNFITDRNYLNNKLKAWIE